MTVTVGHASLIIGVLLTSSSIALNHRRDAYDIDPYYSKEQVRRSYCVNAAGKCFSSGQCCRGLVCAAIDDYFGQKPEVPGYCVKEKDLEECVTNADCGGRCVSLGRTGERYCLPKTEDAFTGIIDSSANVPESANLKVHGGGLGSQCATSADCRPVMETSGDALCCQDVRRGRQGVRRICDRVTPISSCITK